MPLFFFDSRDGQTLLPDRDGTELPDFESARREAIQTMAEIAKDALPEDGPERLLAMTVRDASGRPLLEVTITFRTESL